MFPARWMLIGQFKFAARQPYARLSLIFNNVTFHNKLFHKHEFDTWKKKARVKYVRTKYTTNQLEKQLRKRLYNHTVGPIRDTPER